MIESTCFSPTDLCSRPFSVVAKSGRLSPFWAFYSRQKSVTFHLSIDAKTTGDAHIVWSGSITFIADILSVYDFSKSRASRPALYVTECIERLLASSNSTQCSTVDIPSSFRSNAPADSSSLFKTSPRQLAHPLAFDTASYQSLVFLSFSLSVHDSFLVTMVLSMIKANDSSLDVFGPYW